LAFTLTLIICWLLFVVVCCPVYVVGCYVGCCCLRCLLFTYVVLFTFCYIVVGWLVVVVICCCYIVGWFVVVFSCPALFDFDLRFQLLLQLIYSVVHVYLHLRCGWLVVTLLPVG